jgi:hypothetical protein
MPLLFTALTACFVGLAIAAAQAGSWVFAVVGVALAIWMGSLVLKAVRPRRG